MMTKSKLLRAGRSESKLLRAGRCEKVYRSFYSPPKDFLFCPDAFLGNGFSDFVVILQEYELAYEDGSNQVWMHCTNWK